MQFAANMHIITTNPNFNIKLQSQYRMPRVVDSIYGIVACSIDHGSSNLKPNERYGINCVNSNVLSSNVQYISHRFGIGFDLHDVEEGDAVHDAHLSAQGFRRFSKYNPIHTLQSSRIQCITRSSTNQLQIRLLTRRDIL